MARSIRTVFEFTTRASTGGLSAVRDELEGVSDATEEIGEEAKEASSRTAQAERGFGSLGKAASIAKAAIAGAAIALASVAIGSAVRGFVEADEAMASFQARTGVTADELAAYRDTAQQIYNMGLGDSFNDVAEAMSTVQTITGLSGDGLQEATRRALVFADAFDRDVTESIRAAQNMANVWGNDASENFDILAGMMQATGDPANDLLDTFNEYASTFERLNFDILEMGAILDTGLEAGAHNTDVIADAVREWGIRLQDGTSELALMTLGLTDLNSEFQSGDASGGEFFSAVVNGLREIEDPLERNRLGVELFGSKWEDMGEDVILALDPAISQTYELGNAIDEADAALSGTVGRTWTRFTRTLRTTLTNALGPFIQKGLDVLIPLLEKLTQNSPEIVALGAAFVALGVAIPIISSLAGAFSILLGPIGLVLIAVAALGAAFATNFLGIRDTVMDVVGGVKQLYEELKSAFQEGGLPQLLTVLWGKIKEGVINAAEWVDEKIVDPIVTYINGIDWGEVENDLSVLLDKFLAIAGSTIESVGSWLDAEIITPIVTYLSAVDWSGVASKLSELLEKFLSFVGRGVSSMAEFVSQKIITPIVDYLSGVDWSSVGSKLLELLEKFLSFVGRGVSSMAEFVSQKIITPIVTYLSAVDWADVGSKLVSLLEKLLGLVGSGLESIGTWVWDNLISPIVTKLGAEDTWTSVFNAAVELGGQIFNGIVDAIAGIPQAIVDKVNEGMQKALDALGIGGGGEDWSGSGQPPVQGGGGGMSDAWSHRDTGGFGVPGVPYLIGTRAQPELFIPDSPGQFYPRGQYSLVSEAAGGGAVINNTYWEGAIFNISGVQDVEGLFRQLENLKRRKNIQ